jgi:hypothetical protein
MDEREDEHRRANEDTKQDEDRPGIDDDGHSAISSAEMHVQSVMAHQP